jgi:hypothetical protein
MPDLAEIARTLSDSATGRVTAIFSLAAAGAIVLACAVIASVISLCHTERHNRARAHQ